MKSISVAELHERTDEWVRQVAHFGQIVIVDGDQAVARMQAVTSVPVQGLFRDRRLLPEFVALAAKTRRELMLPNLFRTTASRRACDLL